MLRKVRVYGRLAKFLKRRVFQADVSSAAEAVRFLLANFPQLEAHMMDQHYRVTVGSYDLELKELHDPAGAQEIKITPVIVGAGGSVGRIIAGVGLIAFAALTAGAGTILGIGLGTTAALAVGSIGVSLALGGVAQLLTPTPRIDPLKSREDTNQDPRKTYSFSGIQQTSRQGVPVPIVYGETIVGSVVISLGIDTEKVKA
jgi:predicted phage tail protein